MQKTLLLVDGTSYLYRAYHAMAPLTSHTGQPTGAVYGVLNMLRKLRQDVQHDYACCVFDAKGDNFRHQWYPEYKANRPPMPDDLRPQAKMLPEIVQLNGWPVISLAGVEADDVIGTLAKQAERQGWQVVISTGDKDMAQLVSEQITLVNTMSGEVLDIAGVVNKFGVRPEQMVDYLSLVGDKIDNVPGVEKCGPKTAVKWLSAYGSLAGVMAHATEIQGKIGEYLQAALSHLPLSQRLVTIKTDIDLQAVLPHLLEDLRPSTPNWAKLVPHFQSLGFKTWLKEAESQLSTNSPNGDLFTDYLEEVVSATPEYALNTPAEIVELQYAAITTVEQLEGVCERLRTVERIGLDTETTSLDTMTASLVGISIAFAPGEAVYIPVGHHLTSLAQQLSWQTVSCYLKPFLESETLHKVGQNIKYDMHILANMGITLRGIVGDSMLASYLVESHLGHGLDELADRYLGLKTIQYEDLCGKGSKQITFADVDISLATEYACQDADLTLRIEKILCQKMDEAQKHLYQHIELPITRILFHMERVGVLLDTAELAKQSHELGTELLNLEQQAYSLAGQRFNLNSPKQLQDILFNRMGIPTKGLKKTASGGVSTNEAVLEKLALDYPLPRIILQSRGLAKLKSTYTDKLPEMINMNTGRVHTTYAQAVVNTGRLASNNPNLQNIPIRTEQGRKVRRAFVAQSGYSIVSADYSQIELRIMAHLSGDKTLIDAFNHGEDIHRRTAAEIFGVAADTVSSEQRRYAKTINFGLIYGMGQYGLAKALGIDNDAAKHFIQQYFTRYPSVLTYMNVAKQQAQENGFVKTLLGRKLYLSGIHSTNAQERAAAERAAINAPMQGTAADLIKQAMIDVFNWIVKHRMSSRIIMQIHDELVLEVPHDELSVVCTQLPEIMARAGQLTVPLFAEVGVGMSWEEAH